MKPFNLERALAGDPVVTRDGREVTEIYYFETCIKPYPVAAISNGIVRVYTKRGSALADDVPDPLDLFMAPKNRNRVPNIREREREE